MAKRQTRYNMYEAKTKLSEIVNKARSGAEVVLMIRGEPVAKVVPYEKPAAQRRLGFAKGKVEILPGFDKTPKDFKDYT